MAFQESDQRGKKWWLAGTRPQFVSPDSGQVDEPFGASFVTKHCCKRCEAQNGGVVWSQGLYHVDYAGTGKEARWPRS